MKIEPANLPAEGQHFEGELESKIFELEENGLRSAGPLSYSLFVQQLDNELVMLGALEATFELTCMRSLHGFSQTVTVSSAAVSIPVDGADEIDISPALREEILLELPTNPRCEDGDDPGECKIDPRYLAVDKPVGSGVDNAAAQEKPSPWAALDGLKASESLPSKDQSS